MYTEFTIYDKNISEQELLETIFKVLSPKVGGINVSPNYLPVVADILPSNLLLSCPIDYPYGLQNTTNRRHEILSAIRLGANCVDLVLNSIYIVNNKKDKLIDDIKAQQSICKDRNVLLRIMLEYRHITRAVYDESIDICKNLKLKYIFPSTNHFSDDFSDNLIMSKIINNRYLSAKVICNGNVWTKDQYDFLLNSGIYGTRLKINQNFKSFISV